MNSAFVCAGAEMISYFYLPPSSGRDKIVGQEFKFQPFFGILTEVHKFFGFYVV